MLLLFGGDDLDDNESDVVQKTTFQRELCKWKRQCLERKDATILAACFLSTFLSRPMQPHEIPAIEFPKAS